MLPKEFITVTPFSKYLAMTLFIIFPFLGFYLGMQYQKSLNTYSQISPQQKQTIKYMQRSSNLNINNSQASNINASISYIIPNGWKLDTSNTVAVDTIQLLSPDVSAGYEGPKTGTVINIRKISMGVYKSVDDYIANINPAAEYTLEKVPMTIDGLQAYKYQSKYNGFWITYTVFKNGYEWSFSLVPADQSTQQKYLQLFMSFMRSVHLK